MITNYDNYVLYCTWEIFWQTIQVKAIGKEKFGEQATISAYAEQLHFLVYLCTGEENFGE